MKILNHKFKGQSIFTSGALLITVFEFVNSKTKNSTLNTIQKVGLIIDIITLVIVITRKK